MEPVRGRTGGQQDRQQAYNRSDRSKHCISNHGETDRLISSLNRLSDWIFRTPSMVLYEIDTPKLKGSGKLKL